MQRMIFHHPLPVISHAMSGSRVRPAQMLRAFRDLGYEVDVVAGYSAERRAAMQRVRSSIAEGERYAFCYSESSTMPFALTDPSHLPLHGEMDLRFLAEIAKAEIPVGVFYRDAQWLLGGSGKGAIEAAKSLIARQYYIHELHLLRKLPGLIFVPSHEFANWLGLGEGEKTSLLPPGCEIRPDGRGEAKPYTMAYVGGITGPIYDISPFFEVAKLLPAHRFLLVCRDFEWIASNLKRDKPDNIDVRNASSEELDTLLGMAKYFAILVKPTEYFSIAMPVKLFDAIGRGLPIIASEGTAVAEFVKREETGWVVSSANEAATLIAELEKADGKDLMRSREKLRSAAERNTWQSRARQVARELMAIRSQS